MTFESGWVIRFNTFGKRRATSFGAGLTRACSGLRQTTSVRRRVTSFQIWRTSGFFVRMGTTNAFCVSERTVRRARSVNFTNRLT